MYLTLFYYLLSSQLCNKANKGFLLPLWLGIRDCSEQVSFFPLREETEAAAPEPQIDLEDLLEVPNEEQKLKLQEILHECASPTEDFITELLSRLKGLRRVTNPQKK
ncbi:protein phosphatase 1 regulatory subunit 14D isoform 3-T3 [Morphnus guianensis]